MSESENGGPAFPTDSAGRVGAFTWHYEGLSMRDWFAGQALAGYIAASAVEAMFDTNASHEEAACRSYQLADAMLAERQKGSSEP